MRVDGVSGCLTQSTNHMTALELYYLDGARTGTWTGPPRCQFDGLCVRHAGKKGLLEAFGSRGKLLR